MSSVVVGAPVHERAWILQGWFDALAKQTAVDSHGIYVLLNYGESQDETLDIILDECGSGRWAGVEVIFDSGRDHERERNWNKSRYDTMVRLRNALLARVRDLKPAYYLSCDTDMILEPDALRVCMEELCRGNYDAIAPLAYMTPEGTDFFNAMNFGFSGRPEMQASTFEVGACFGVSLMTPGMYNEIDYSTHGLGEDLGWALRARMRKKHMALCPLVHAKHVMTREMALAPDPRVGF